MRNLMLRFFSRSVRRCRGDRAEVRLIRLYDDITGIADIAEIEIADIAEVEVPQIPSHTNLRGNILHYDDITGIDDIAEIEIADIAEVGEPLLPVMPVMP